MELNHDHVAQEYAILPCTRVCNYIYYISKKNIRSVSEGKEELTTFSRDFYSIRKRFFIPTTRTIFFYLIIRRCQYATGRRMKFFLKTYPAMFTLILSLTRSII